MRFYILDDDINTVQMLSNLIEDLDLGKVVRTATDPQEAIHEIETLGIDICLLDYLMPKLDGSTLIKKVKEKNKSVDFIMISQVSDQEMVSASYLNGAEFFIHKPLNTIEFKKVVLHVMQKRQMNEKINHIRQFLGEIPGEKQKVKTTTRQRFERIFMDLGMMGEKGTYDLLNVCESFNTAGGLSERELSQWLVASGERPKTVSQRMRRAISKGLNNIAHLGLDDFGHETFINYAYKFFDPQSVREETAYINGNRKSGGKPNLLHFLNCMIIEVQSQGKIG